MKQRIDITMDGVTSIGLFVGDAGAALVQTVRRDGKPVEVLTLRGAQPWPLLVEALNAAPSDTVAIYTNDRALATALTPPFPPPTPDKTEQGRYWGKVQYGGDDQHWACLRALAMLRFKAFLVDGAQLKRARTIYDASDIDSNTYNDRCAVAARATVAQANSNGSARKGVPAATYTAEERRYASLVLGGKARQSVHHPRRRNRRQQTQPVPAGA